MTRSGRRQDESSPEAFFSEPLVARGCIHIVAQKYEERNIAL
jgi:hypothetical protein